MLYLSNADVAQVLDMRTTLEALRAGYADLARGDAAYIPRIDLFAPTASADSYYVWGSMTGYCRATGVVATRIKSDVITWPEGGKTQDKYCIRPGTYCGIILLFSARDGEPLAMLNDGYLQHLRVGACAGLGADVLARRNTEVLGMLGSGGMARAYLEAIAQVRSLRVVKVYSPTRANREAFAEEMAEKVGVQVVAVDTPEAAVRGSDIVATATDSMEPTFRAEWVAPGAHLTCVTRRELDRAIMQRVDVVAQLGIHTLPPTSQVPQVEYLQSGVACYVAGQPEERARIPRKPAEQGEYPHLLDIQSGRAPGRTSPDQITLFINTGTQGLQFAAVAGRAYQLARERGLGRPMPLDWFLQDIRD